MNTEKFNIFVYGTLRFGHGNHRFLERAIHIGNGRTTTRLSLYYRGLPYALERGQNVGIYGEVYQVDQSTLINLDRLEGHPNFYQRVRDVITLNDGNKVAAWIYVLNMNGTIVRCNDLQLIPSGDFNDISK